MNEHDTSDESSPSGFGLEHFSKSIQSNIQICLID